MVSRLHALRMLRAAISAAPYWSSGSPRPSSSSSGTAARGVPIVGLEPSCLLTLRDELLSFRSDDQARSVGAHALLLEEFLVREAETGREFTAYVPSRKQLEWQIRSRTALLPNVEIVHRDEPGYRGLSNAFSFRLTLTHPLFGCLVHQLAYFKEV